MGANSIGPISTGALQQGLSDDLGVHQADGKPVTWEHNGKTRLERQDALKNEVWMPVTKAQAEAADKRIRDAVKTDSAVNVVQKAIDRATLAGIAGVLKGQGFAEAVKTYGKAAVESALKAAGGYAESAGTIAANGARLGLFEAAPLIGAVGVIAVPVRAALAAEDLKTAGDRDAMDLYVLEHGHFDPEFLAAQRKRFGEGVSSGRLGETKAVRAHAKDIERQVDVGREVASVALEYPGGPAAYLRDNPETARLVKGDIAFAYGWDEVLHFAKEHRDDKLQQIRNNVSERQRAEELPVPIRG